LPTLGDPGNILPTQAASRRQRFHFVWGSISHRCCTYPITTSMLVYINIWQVNEKSKNWNHEQDRQDQNKKILQTNCNVI